MEAPKIFNRPDAVRRRLLQGLVGSGAIACLPGCGSGGGGVSLPNNQAPATPGPPDMAPTPDPLPDPNARFAPRGLHASVTEDVHSSRTITWFTDGLEAPDSVIEFDSVQPYMTADAIKNQAFDMRFTGSSEPTFGVDAFTHRATASGIDPDLPLRYRVGSDDGWSGVHILPATPREDWTFVHFGDFGTDTPLPLRVAAELARQQYDLLLLAGDLSYANGDQPVWDDWFNRMQPLFANRITMAAPGNHEEEDNGGKSFKNRFSHPNPIIGGGRNSGSTFYSFDYNRIHFLVTTAGALVRDLTLPVEIVAIEADLALAAARRAAGRIDFIIVMQHFTIWTDQAGRSPNNPTLVALEENILVRYGVDLLLAGHDHVYQRSLPMSFGFPNPLGYVQMMVGTGGQSIRLFDDNGIQPWSAKEFVGIGFCRYKVSGETITAQYLASPPIGLEDELRQTVQAPFSLQDEFTIKARDLLGRRLAAKPARNAEQLLADYPEIEKHTLERNRFHLAAHG